MNVEQQLLLEWIVQRIKAFSPSYFEIMRVLLEGFGDEAFSEFDGTTLFPMSEADRKLKMSQVRKGKGGVLFIASRTEDSSFYLQSMFTRCSGVKTVYSYAIAEDGTLTVKEELSLLIA